MYVCVCNAVTDRQIREAARLGARSLSDLQRELKVATCCGRCADCAREVLAQAHVGGVAAKPAWGAQPVLA
jgi:bacterioferritin-associated ferredoxin